MPNAQVKTKTSLRSVYDCLNQCSPASSPSRLASSVPGVELWCWKHISRNPLGRCFLTSVSLVSWRVLETVDPATRFVSRVWRHSDDKLQNCLPRSITLFQEYHYGNFLRFRCGVSRSITFFRPPFVGILRINRSKNGAMKCKNNFFNYTFIVCLSNNALSFKSRI